MKEIIKLESVAEYNKMVGVETLHPLVSVIDFSKIKPIPQIRRNLNFYTVYLKDVVCGDMRYGRHIYDYQEGTLLFIAPGQVSGIDNDGAFVQPLGYALLFHPDLIRGTALGKHIQDYSFFSYEFHEALHLSEKERKTILECLDKIDHELRQGIDKHSKKLIVNNIELFLNYCMRYYDRQFITREDVHKGAIEKFEQLLNEYFQSDQPQTVGLPTVAYFAEKLNLSAKYFGDLIKKETGKSAQEYIQTKVMDVAKEKIFDHNKSISEIAYGLGFKYPQHFTRVFKQRIGMSPNDYRLLN
jgi:AraC-like DNA-binding protein